LVESLRSAFLITPLQATGNALRRCSSINNRK
jgi:hypothetical protein